MTSAPRVLVAFTVMSAGGVMVGASISFTVTSCGAEAVLPEASVAVQVIVVPPTLYGAARAAPSLRALEPFTSGQLSAASATPTATPADARCGSLPAETLPGALIDGFSLSLTVMVWMAVAVIPSESVAFHVIVVTPFG